MKKLIIVMILGLIIACNPYKELPSPIQNTGWKVKKIPPYPQQLQGSPEKGLDYVMYGNYLGTGVPYAMLEKRFKTKDPVLNRTEKNENAPYLMNVFAAPNDIDVVNGNCFACHAGTLNGKRILGLGNSLSDFRKDMSFPAKILNTAIKTKYGKASEEWDAYETFGKVYQKLTPYIVTNNPGVNPAARLAEACVMHRNPEDLTYQETPNYEMPDYTIATDVPPLWNVKKKNALYYTAVGRGDFTKLLFQASFMGIQDSTAARKAASGFTDVLAWINSLEPPTYPKTISQQLAQEGQAIFEEHCSGCHGTYGENPTYPNKVVSLDVIKTDPYYASYAVEAKIVDWYNSSWFATSYPHSWHEPQAGYIAPPLDGIWATAPYFHNGSVPTLAGVIDSKNRPTYWSRTEDSRDYDFENLGWQYISKKNKSGKLTYDTTLPSYSNEGHYFGDKLNEKERSAVLEYLKTL